MLLALLFLTIGLVLLVYGADLLVKGASKIAISFGISSLVVGLTVVASGTSAPEMSVSVMSAYSGQSAMAVGNVVGSNIFNVLFILGVSAIITPLLISRQLVRLDVPVMIAASLCMLLVCQDGIMHRYEGMILFAVGVAYTWWLIRMSRRATQKERALVGETHEEKSSGPMWLNVVLIVAGLVMLVVGSKLLVDAAITIAKAFGLSEAIIGLTIVAAGTSLPEVATSMMATIKGERDIAVGNVVGSNIFNIFSVAGVSAVVAPSGLTVAVPMVNFDIPFMVVIALVCLPLFLTGFTISRWNGFFFLFYYVAYTTYLIMGAQNHDSLPIFGQIMFNFAAPITAVMVIAALVYEWKIKHPRQNKV